MKPQSWVILQKKRRDTENRFLFSFSILSFRWRTHRDVKEARRCQSGSHMEKGKPCLEEKQPHKHSSWAVAAAPALLLKALCPGSEAGASPQEQKVYKHFCMGERCPAEEVQVWGTATPNTFPCPPVGPTPRGNWMQH